MKILILNAGSVSLKYKVFDQHHNVLREGNIQGIGNKRTPNHATAMERVIREVGKEEVDVCGHRYVHGGTEFIEPIKINKSVLNKLKKLHSLAPLHNPANYQVLTLAREAFPQAEHYAVFDTAFHASIPQEYSEYALPQEIVGKYSIRRFGFHGISNEYVVEEMAEGLKKPKSSLALLSFHLGGGTSVTAIKNGRSYMTSMGMTPLPGPIMMSRSGDIDPGVIFYLARKAKMTLPQIEGMLNEDSGLKALAGSPDYQKVYAAATKGSAKHKLALKIYTNSLQQYAGAFATQLRRIDALVFTGSIGYNAPHVRAAISNMPLFDGVPVYRVKPNEELAIAKKIQEVQE